MKKYIFISIFICLETILLFFIIVLGLKILRLHEEKVKGVQYVTRIDKNNVIFDDSKLKYFYEPKPNSIETAHPDWLGYTATYTINSDSLNSKSDYSIQKDATTYRIITLGDSFTFGEYVNTEDNYPSILEKLLNNRLTCSNIKKFEVINLGVGGYDIEYEIARYRKRGVKYNPNLLIWLVSEGNFTIINEKVRPDTFKFNSKGIIEEDPITKRSIARVQAIGETQKKLGLTYIINHQLNNLTKIFSIYSHNILILNYYSMSTSIMEGIHSISKENNKIVFINNLIPELENDLYHLADRHPNTEGHKIIAEDIFNYLVKNYFQDCNFK